MIYSSIKTFQYICTHLHWKRLLSKIIHFRVAMHVICDGDDHEYSRRSKIILAALFISRPCDPKAINHGNHLNAMG